MFLVCWNEDIAIKTQIFTHVSVKIILHVTCFGYVAVNYFVASRYSFLKSVNIPFNIINRLNVTSIHVMHG